MKAIILAAGYATRLYPLTKNIPKALLPINDKPIIQYIVDELNTIDNINQIIVVSNNKFYDQLYNWASTSISRIPIDVLNDGTTSDQDKKGAIGDILFCIDTFKIDDDFMVIAGDCFFTFNLRDFYDFYNKNRLDSVCAEEIKDTEDLKRFAVASLDSNNQILELEEKPQNPKSNTVVYAMYIYKKSTIPKLQEYMTKGLNPDAPGYFVEWLYKQQPVLAYKIDGLCYDIGTIDSYNYVQNTHNNKH